MAMSSSAGLFPEMRHADPRRILVVGAHPDDEVLGVGGTIARHVLDGDEVCVLILTDGVTSHHNETAMQKTAARSACQTLGTLDVRFVDLPDQRLDAVPLLEVIQPISAAIKELRPDVVYTHHRGDANQDHRTAFAATLVAARPFGDNPVQRLLCYEVASSTEWGAPFAESAFLPTVFVDISQTLDLKVKALEAYRGTFVSEVRPFPHPRSPEAVRVHAVHRGVAVGARAAEAFVLVRELCPGVVDRPRAFDRKERPLAEAWPAMETVNAAAPSVGPR